MTDSKSIASYLAGEVRNGTISMSLHPGCIRLSEHKFLKGAIGRYGPNGRVEPWVYTKPRSLTFYFHLHEGMDEGTEHQKNFEE